MKFLADQYATPKIAPAKGGNQLLDESEAEKVPEEQEDSTPGSIHNLEDSQPKNQDLSPASDDKSKQAKKEFQGFVKEKLKKRGNRPAKKDFKKRVARFKHFINDNEITWGSEEFYTVFDDFFITRKMTPLPAELPLHPLPSEENLNPIALKNDPPPMELPPLDIDEILSMSELDFYQLSLLWNDITDKDDRKKVLDLAIRTAQSKVKKLRNMEIKPGSPAEPIYSKYKKITGRFFLDKTPFLEDYIDNNAIESIYQAWARGAKSPPWILMALWVKEGRGGKWVKEFEDHSNPMPASSPENAKILYRSGLYYTETGTDVFVNYTYVQDDDNTVSVHDSGAASHEAAFKNMIKKLINEGYLSKDISSEITAEITATLISPGHYQMSVSNKFYALTSMLADAYFRKAQDAVAKDPDVPEDLRWSYAYWNNPSTYKGVKKSGEGHRKEKAYEKAGKYPSLTEFTFETTPKKGEYETPRLNAIRFQYFSEIYRLVFEEWE